MKWLLAVLLSFSVAVIAKAQTTQLPKPEPLQSETNRVVSGKPEPLEAWEVETGDPEFQLTRLQQALAALDPAQPEYRSRLGTLNMRLADLLTDRVSGNRAENLERAIAAYEAALTVYTREAKPDEWAGAQNDLGRAYGDRVHGDRAENLERAIAAYEAALTVHTQTAAPENWATTQNNLGVAYGDRVRGDRAENLERAIAAYEAALTVYTRTAAPEDWAMTQNNLGVAYGDRVRSDRAENLERAIAAYEAALTVRTRKTLPMDWAATQNNLGVAYGDRVRGDRAENLERAIAAYEAALTVYTRTAAPEDWAMTQNNLGVAYGNRVRSDRAENLERAIAAYEATLTVYTREAEPRNWAQSQNNLGLAYADRVRGDRAENLERAIAAHEAALTVYTRDALPLYWAATQENFGIAYANRVRGDRAENLERAIAAYEAVLTVRTRDALPLNWTSTQNNLGAAYANRVRGDRAENLERAIAAYEAALTVRTRDALPLDWSATQSNLGTAYANRVRGDQAENLERAITAYEAALTVRTRDALPREHIRTARLWGDALATRNNWELARRAYGSAAEALRDLAGDELNDAEVAGLIDVAGPLFDRAAFAEVQGGDNWRALALLEEGRTRLLQVALRLNDLSLSNAERDQLVALRRRSRELEARLTQRGDSNREAISVPLDRGAMLEEIGALRRQMRVFAERGQPPPELAIATRIRALLPPGGALAAPIVSRFGTMLVIVAEAGEGLTATLHPLPSLSVGGWTDLLGDSAVGVAADNSGWLGSYRAAFDVDSALTPERWTLWQQQVASTADAIWTVVGRDLAAALVARGISEGARVGWLAPGRMAVVPIGLARDAATGKPLLERYEIAILPSLSLRVAASVETASLGALVDPTGDLPFAAVEGALVASRFSVTTRSVLSAASSADSVLAALAGRSYWHIAGHARFSWADPGAGGIMLGGGTTLSVRDLLARLGQTSPRLVVLSACESGLADVGARSDEYFGLPMALLAGGAQAVVATQWPVPDLPTMFLMARFYELHLGPAKRHPVTALREAQLWLRDASTVALRAFVQQAFREGRLSALELAWIRDKNLGQYVPEDHPFRDPVYWAGFTITGL